MLLDLNTDTAFHAQVTGYYTACVVGKLSEAVSSPQLLFVLLKFMYFKELSDIDLRQQNEYNGAVGLSDSPLYHWCCRKVAGLESL